VVCLSLQENSHRLKRFTVVQGKAALTRSQTSQADLAGNKMHPGNFIVSCQIRIARGSVAEFLTAYRDAGEGKHSKAAHWLAKEAGRLKSAQHQHILHLGAGGRIG
jgi:hypothetical protein